MHEMRKIVEGVQLDDSQEPSSEEREPDGIVIQYSEGANP